MLALDWLGLSYSTAVLFIPVPQEGKWHSYQKQLVCPVLSVGADADVRSVAAG